MRTNTQLPATGSTEDARTRFISSPIMLTTIFVALVVSGFIGFSLFWNITNLNRQHIKLATAEAESHWNKDLAFRRWGARHGGVYVRPDNRTQPNPYLSHIPNRDVETSDGMKLTLMNPAFMMTQITRESEQIYGIKGNITAKKLLNPNNKPDDWEVMALTRFESGAEKIIEQKSIAGEPYLRYMKPMYMTKGCVKCHAVLGFKEGDLRGGISVSIPLTPYFIAASETTRSMWTTHGIVWILAMASIFLFTHVARSRRRERVSLLHRLEHDAMHDSLTNLPNRQLFTDRLNHAVHRSTRDQNYQFSVCFLDLDRFKNLNDSYGHLMGDALLIQVSERFQQVLRPADSVARIGGDEFTFLLDGVSGLNEAVIISERILGSLKQPFMTDVGNIYINASIGLCLSNDSYSLAEDMLRDADIALYRAKAEGKGRVDVFNQDMHEQAKLVMRMENDLRHAMQENQLEIYYQPVINIDKNCINGFEALLRWQHPELGFISPDVFIPIAEDTGLIRDIGTWVIEQACSTVRDWNLEFANDQPLSLSVNLSAKQLVQVDLVESIQSILTATRFDARHLHCEVTETAVIQHREHSAKVIDELKNQGVSISVDDFGKGYSSLTYLQEYNFDTLKIDKEFVQDMNAEGKGLQLVKTMMLLARDFNMKIIAEGVEQADQLNRLQALGCKTVQGFYFSRPQPVEWIHGLLKKGLHRDANKLCDFVFEENPDLAAVNSPAAQE